MKLAGMLATVAALIAASPALADTVPVNPAGQSGNFAWDDGLGPIDEIDAAYDLNNVNFSLSANAGEIVNVWLDDCCAGGDQFALYLNGSLLSPTSTTTSVDNVGADTLEHYFFGNVQLAGGTNIFTIDVTNLGLDQSGAPYLQGGATYTFGAVRSAVPEPGTWAMMLLGFGAIGFALRRRNAELPQLG